MELNKDISQSKSETQRSFRFVLQDELAKRCSLNPNYSLRSFARSLSVSPAALSDMLNNKRPITHKMKERIGFQLGLSPQDLESFTAKPHGNSKIKTEAAPELTFQPVAIDVFSVISEPYHYAILELIKTNSFKWDFKWISQRLQLTISEVKIAVERLERVGLLKREDGGTVIDTTHGNRSDLRDGYSSEAQRRSLIRSHEFVIEAIKTVPVEHRDNTTMTMAVNKKDLPKARQLMKEFRRRFCVELESSHDLDEVYQLAISFVPITNLKNKNLKRGKK